MNRDKIALITGASRGIGAETAMVLANQGFDLCINYFANEFAAKEVVDGVIAAGRKAIAVKADVSCETEVVSLFEKIDTELGPVTHLVNNAGILSQQTNLLGLDEQRINKILTTNVTSVFLCCREAVKRMKENTHPENCAIVNVSSRASVLGSPGEYVDYAASKGAIDSLTIGLSKELAEFGIRVNAIRPGFINTDIHKSGGEPDRIERIKDAIPLRRGGEPKEVANAISWLLSEKASYATGTFIDVAGGR